jgi:L-ribulokinase
VEDAMQAMGQGFDAEYHPDAEKVPLYAKRYGLYKKFGAFIEGQTRGKEAAVLQQALQNEEAVA